MTTLTRRARGLLAAAPGVLLHPRALKARSAFVADPADSLPYAQLRVHGADGRELASRRVDAAFGIASTNAWLARDAGVEARLVDHRGRVLAAVRIPDGVRRGMAHLWAPVGSGPAWHETARRP